MSNYIRGSRLIVIFLLLIFIIVFSGCTKDVEGIAARVNDEDISIEEFDTEFQIYKESYERQLGEDALSMVGSDGRTREAEIKQVLLDTLIVEKLIIQDSSSNAISITDEEVDKRIEELSESLGGELAFEEFLESNAMTREYFTNFTRNNLIFAKHKDYYVNSIDIDEDEAERYFNENKDDLIELRASHILLSNEEDANRVLEALNKGQSFDDLALTESKDSRSAMNGGDLGYFEKGAFAGVQEFEKEAFSLEVGEISGLVKTEVGYHIIRLDERKDTFEGLKNKIKVLLKNQEYEKHLEGLRDRAEIKIYMEIE